MNKRLRKKKCVKEFRRIGFSVKFSVSNEYFHNKDLFDKIREIFTESPDIRCISNYKFLEDEKYVFVFDFLYSKSIPQFTKNKTLEIRLKSLEPLYSIEATENFKYSSLRSRVINQMEKK